MLTRDAELGEHRTPYEIPWCYWVMRFDFKEHHRRYYEGRGHSPSAALSMAMIMASLTM